MSSQDTVTLMWVAGAIALAILFYALRLLKYRTHRQMAATMTVLYGGFALLGGLAGLAIACRGNEAMSLWFEVSGWAGGAVLVYVLYSSTKPGADARSLTFLLLNFFGGVGIVMVSFYYGAWPPGALNVVWALVALKRISEKADPRYSSAESEEPDP